MKLPESFRQAAALFLPVLLLVCSTYTFGQTQDVLYRFKGGSDSDFPTAGLVADKAGNLYGTTTGFQLGCGTVFELLKPEQAWTEQVIHTFDCTNDATPYDSLIIDNAGNLYGTTFDNSEGSVFELSPPATQGGEWTETVLHSFSGGNGNGDGAGSVASLVMDKSGNLYGTTENGGNLSGPCASSDGCGVVFELSPPSTQGGAWTETIIRAFHGSDGRVPAAGLVLDQIGDLYGTTYYGGPADVGIVFRLAPPTQGGSWRETVLYGFTGGSDGGNPGANLVLRGRNLYGTLQASLVGNSCQGCGAVFELSAPNVQGSPWTETTLHAFSGNPDGRAPYAPVFFDKAGNLYTTTAYGGINDNGTIVELSPPLIQGGAWSESILYRFTGGSDGSYPFGGLIMDPAGIFFSTTYGGGAKCTSNIGFCGTVFEFKP